MIQNILFNDRLLKEFSPIPLNFNTKEVKNYCKLAEVQWLLPIIGDAFYEELLYEIEKNKLTPENSTALVEAIYPYLGFCVAYEALPSMLYHVSEVGVTKSKSDNSESISLKETTYFEGHLRRQIEARKDYLIKWLDEHAESFRLYHPSNCCCDECCAKRPKLRAPNPMFSIYGMRKINTDLK